MKERPEMIRKRAATSRGHANYGWLDTWHTFSFADYHDPAEMGWSCLRVLNDDTVAAGKGFGTHGHRDMEIVSIVLDGALEHRDSMGTGTVIRPGEVQRMSAGRGVTHSEFNPLSDQAAHFLQIWIVPAAPGGEPGYEQKNFPAEQRLGRWCLLASDDGRESSLTLRQDASIYVSRLLPGQSLSRRLGADRAAYVHLIRGALTVNGLALGTADGAKIEDEENLEFSVTEDAEWLFFDLKGNP
jgi:redox-sensitive bicupin YhaK (pirin superfamily)